MKAQEKRQEMKPKINLSEIPGWENLSESCICSAKQMMRILEDYVSEWRSGCVHQVLFCVDALAERSTQIQLYAADSLLCALTHNEPLIAMRALLQAAGYVAECRALGFSNLLNLSTAGDAYTTARNRVEDFFKAQEVV